MQGFGFAAAALVALPLEVAAAGAVADFSAVFGDEDIGLLVTAVGEAAGVDLRGFQGQCVAGGQADIATASVKTG